MIMESVYIKQLLYFGILGSISISQAQVPKDIFTNDSSTISLASTAVMSTTYDFDNSKRGNFISDGITYYYGDFNNDGIYTINTGNHTAKAVFEQYENIQGLKRISGDGISSFFDVDFNSAIPTMAFDLKNNIDINGTMSFINGIVKVDSTFNPRTKGSYGMVSFQNGAKVDNVRDVSYIEGDIEKIGNEEFKFPIGNKGFYRYAQITAPRNIKDVFMGKYMFNDKAFFKEHSSKAGVINVLNTQEFWTIEKGNKNSKGDIMLTLSWNEDTTPMELLREPLSELHIVRWDEKQKMWVDEGGIVDLSTKEIKTPTSVKGYGYFTLATIKTDWILDEDVVIYNLVSPNGDGKNDYFTIANIEKFSNNNVEIFNRWGAKVYETSNYGNTGNVFKGYSEGKVTVRKNQKLPTGTYFYIVTYEYKKAGEKRMIKKSGYLHLESSN